jgi:hypothetical protein
VGQSRTNSPLQALNLMNDVTFVEAARKLGERMMVEGGATAQTRIAYGYRMVLSRAPGPNRDAILERAFEQFRFDPKSAAALLKTGDSPVREGLDAAELAAYATVASLLLNMDETITKE